MDYFLYEKTEQGVIYSVDKVCVMGKLDFREVEKFSDNLSWFLACFVGGAGVDLTLPWCECSIADYKHFVRYGVGEYKHNFNISLNNGASFYFGCFHNSSKIGTCSWKIELNPNKCLPCVFVDNFLRFVISRSKYNSLRISQADIAFDFPLPRKNFYLEKDKRIYSTCNDGADNITEYLSRHNTHGFCKLYNKTVESKLDYDLTRFEITLQDFTKQNVCSVFPKIHYYDYSQIKLDETLPKLSQNDEIFVELLRLHPEKFQRLTYRKRQFFAPYLNYSAPVYELDWNAFDKLIKRMAVYFIDGLPMA